MYKNASSPPPGGFRHTDIAGVVDNGPSETQREAKAARDSRNPRGNIAPATTTSTATIKKLNKAATKFLATHDKPSDRLKFVNRKRKERADRKNRVHSIR